MKAITEENFKLLQLYKAGKYIVLLEGENNELTAYEISLGLLHPKDYPSRSRVLLTSKAGDSNVGSKAVEIAYNDLKNKTL